MHIVKIKPSEYILQLLKKYESELEKNLLKQWLEYKRDDAGCDFSFDLGYIPADNVRVEYDNLAKTLQTLNGLYYIAKQNETDSADLDALKKVLNRIIK